MLQKALNRAHLHALRDSLSLAYLHMRKGEGINFLTQLIMFIILINLDSPTPVENALRLKKCSSIMPFAFICWDHWLSAFTSSYHLPSLVKHLGRAVGTDLWSFFC